MLDLLNVINLGYLINFLVSPLNLAPVDVFYLPAGKNVVAKVEYQKVVPLFSNDEDKPCRYHGFAVSFARTWPLEIPAGDGGVTELPPTPDKRDGYGFLMYKKTCPGKEALPLYHTGVLMNGPFNASFENQTRVIRPDFLKAYFVPTLTGNNIPKYTAQVMDALKAAATTNPEVAECLENIAQAEKAYLAKATEDAKLDNK